MVEKDRGVLLQKVIEQRQQAEKVEADVKEAEKLIPDFYEKTGEFFREHFPEPERKENDIFNLRLSMRDLVYSLGCEVSTERGPIDVGVNATPYPHIPKDEYDFEAHSRFTIEVGGLEHRLKLDQNHAALESIARHQRGEIIIGGPPLPPEWVKPITVEDVNNYLELLKDLESAKFTTHTFQSHRC